MVRTIIYLKGIVDWIPRCL